MSERFLGAHVSCAGGLERSIANAEQLGINTFQIHPSPPQQWNSKPYPPDFEAEFIKARASSSIKRVFFHAIYLINLASPEERNFTLSRNSLLHYLDLNARIGGDGVIFHSGSLKDQPDETAGLARVADGINWIMERAPKNCRLIIEVAAGSGAVIGDRLEELAAIYAKVEDKSRVGFGLDTQHLWASGYDLKNDLAGFIKQVEALLTFDKIWAVHLNDSKTELGSRKDRHENLGEGLIGEGALKAFVNHPRLVSIPFILETPGLKDMSTAGGEVEKLMRYAKD